MEKVKIPKLKPLQLVEVHWIDMVSKDAWQSVEEAVRRDGSADTWTPGYYLKHDKELLYLAADRGKDIKEDVSSKKIPIGCIKKVRKI